MFEKKDRNAAIVKITLSRSVTVMEEIPTKTVLFVELPGGKIPTGAFTGRLSDGRSITIPKGGFKDMQVVVKPGEIYNDRMLK